MTKIAPLIPRVRHFNRTKSPLELEIKLHYDVLDDEEPWNGTRLDVLCKLLKITRYELAALVRISPHCLVNPTYHAQIPNSTKLLLTLVERTAFATYLGKVYDEPLFPQL
jgi:hypothetical protein